MEIKLGDMVFEGHIEEIEYDVEDEPIPEKVWETKDIVFEYTVYLPFMPPHPYNVVLFYWHRLRNCCMIVQGRDGKCWYL